MSKSNDFENDLLRFFLNAQPIDNLADDAATGPLTSLYVALHTSDPGEGGDQSSNECSYTSYARVATTRKATISSNTDTGSDFTVGNATIDGQAQSFQNTSGGKLAVMRVFAQLKKNNSPTGNIVAKIYAHSGTYGTSSIPTGAALATSNNVDVSGLTGSYVETEFVFDTPVVLDDSTSYVVAFEYSGGDASNYVQIDGLATSGTHGGNRSDLQSSTWSPTAADDLAFRVEGSLWVVTANQAQPAEQIAFPQCTGGTETATHISIGVASGGATKMLYSGTMTPNISISTGAVPIATTDTVISED